MKISAGILIKYKEKYLFCHPTNASWDGTYSPPKGGVDINESLLNAAIRETKEEVGIIIETKMVSNIFDPFEVNYLSKKKEIHKKVYLFLVEIKNLKEIGLLSEIVPKSQLQIEEIDWAGFLTIEELKKKSFHRFLEIFNK